MKRENQRIVGYRLDFLNVTVTCLRGRSRAGTVIALCCNVCCLLAALLEPYMPATAKTLRDQLNAPVECGLIPDRFSPLLPAGHQLGKVMRRVTSCESIYR